MTMRRWSHRHITTISLDKNTAPRRRLGASAPLLLAAALCCGTMGCTSGDTTANADMGPDMGPDGSTSTPSCKGTPLNSDGTLDIDVKTLHAFGKVTLNGATLPDSTDDRGSIVFREKHTGTTAALRLGTQGAGKYEALLAPAQYDISYAPNTAACANPGNRMPCIDGPIKLGVFLTADGALDLDIPAVTVGGKITLNGGTVPADAQGQAAVQFSRTDSGGTGGVVNTGSIGTFLHNYSVVLMKGQYDVAYSPPQLGCSRTSDVPCNSGPIKKAVTLNDSGVLDLDIPAVKLGGRVTVNGQPAAAGDVQMGALTFQLHGGGAVGTSDVNPPSNVEPYQLTVLPGTYDVHFTPQNPTCDSALPCIDGVLKRNLAVSQSGVLDIDVPSIQVQGNVTVAGKPVDAASQTSTLIFANVDKGQVQTIDFGTHQLSQYRLSLIPGIYQVLFAPGDGISCTQSPGLAPCIAGVVKSSVTLTQTGNLDVDVPVVTVGGRVTLNGSDVPPAAISAGLMAFSFADGSGGTLTTADLSPYSLRLLPGTYNVSFQSGNGPGGCDQTAQVPCNGGPVRDNLTLSQSGSLDLDIGMVRVSGRVTLDGMPMPTTSEDRGALFFILGSDAAYTPGFGNFGPVTYNVALLKGGYKIAHFPSATDCTANRKIPCVGQVILGCN